LFVGELSPVALRCGSTVAGVLRRATGAMKKIAIFGATGMTGVCAVEAALKQGNRASVRLDQPDDAF
jgi:hypothetical protein